MRRLLAFFLFIGVSFQTYAYSDADYLGEYKHYWKTSFFSNKKNIFTAADNCFLWVRVNPGVGDLTLWVKQDLSDKTPLTKGYNREFITYLDRHKLERIVEQRSECRSGNCHFELNMKTIMQDSRELDPEQKAYVEVSYTDNKIGIFKVFISDRDGKELFSCYK
jgi:hypothetical protein